MSPDCCDGATIVARRQPLAASLGKLGRGCASQLKATLTGTTTRSRGAMRPEFCKNLALEIRAQGRPGARCTRGLACDVHQRMLHTSIQVQRRTPGLPCAMALRLIRVRPGDRLSCHHHRQRLSPPPDLTPAPGRQAHTTSPPAFATL